MTPAAVMAFEQRLGSAPAGSREAAAREVFAASPTRYYARLNHLLGDPDFIRLDPARARLLHSRRDRLSRGRRLTSAG